MTSLISPTPSMHSLTRPSGGSGVHLSRRCLMPLRRLSPLPPSSPSLPNQPGQLMGRPDALSQRSDRPHGKDDNANVTLLPSDVFEVHNMEATLVDSRGDELVECIWRSTDYDNTVVKAL